MGEEILGAAGVVGQGAASEHYGGPIGCRRLPACGAAQLRFPACLGLEHRGLTSNYAMQRTVRCAARR